MAQLVSVAAELWATGLFSLQAWQMAAGEQKLFFDAMLILRAYIINFFMAHVMISLTSN